MDILIPPSEQELNAFVRLVTFFDWQLSSIQDKEARKAFLDKYHLVEFTISYHEHEELLKSTDLSQILLEECYQQMDMLRSHIIANASLQFLPYIYQAYQPKTLTPEIRKALEFSLEALDWLSVAMQKQRTELESKLAEYGDIVYENQFQEGKDLLIMDEKIDNVLSTKQMAANLSVSYDEFRQQGKENINFARILYSSDENYTRLHETHILTRSFQMYCSEGYSCLDVLLKGHHILLLKSVLYKEVLKPDLSGLTVPIPNYMLLMAETIYVHTVREFLNKKSVNKATLKEISTNLENLGINTYELDILAESFSDQYILYYKEVSSGNKSLSEIPSNFIDQTIAQAAVQYSMENFPSVPEDWQTPEMCSDAISYKPENLRFVNPVFCTIDLCRTAVRQDGLVLQYVPSGFVHEVYNEALLNNGMAIQFIPDIYLTHELALSAVSNNYNAYFLLTVHLKNKETLMLALQQNPSIYKMLPVFDREIVDAALLAINANPALAAHLPETLTTNAEFLELAGNISNGWNDFIQIKLASESIHNS